MPSLGSFPRDLHVSLPCCGIDGAGFALKALSIPFRVMGAWDVEKRYKLHLEAHHQGGNIYVGKDADVCHLDLKTIERPVDILISGPPCPLWAGNGSHKGQWDPRADVFLHVMRMGICLIKTGELKAIVIENVRGILNQQGGNPSFMTSIMNFLQANIPEFAWEVTTLKADAYKLAQQRTRVFLRGIRVSSGGGKVPAPMGPFGHKPLQDFLNPRLPPVDWACLTPTMATNLKAGVKALMEKKKNGEFNKNDIVVFPLDRAEGKVYVRRFTRNIVPTLTTTNKYLFIAPMDLELEEGQRKYFRFLTPEDSSHQFRYIFVRVLDRHFTIIQFFCFD